MQKQLIIDFLKLCIRRIENNECTLDELKQAEEIALTGIDPKVTREEAIQHFGVTKSAFDSRVNRRLPSHFKIKRTVMYPFNEIRKILTER